VIEPIGDEEDTMRITHTATAVLLLLLPLGPPDNADQFSETDRLDQDQGSKQGSPKALVAQQYELSEEDISEVEDGETLVRILRSSDDREFIIFGMTGVEATTKTFVHYTRDAENIGRTRLVQATGPITPLHLASDLESLDIEQDDIDALRSCHVGDCDVKLPAETIHRMQQIDHRAVGWRDDVANALREWLGTYLLRYLDTGNEALVTYHDRPSAQDLEDGLTDLLVRSETLRSYAPALYAYLEGVGQGSGTDIQSVYFWSVEEFGMRPLTTVTEAAVHETDDGRQAWMAFKLLYASHYLQASLRLMHLVEDADGDRPRFVSDLRRSVAIRFESGRC
jgi:hypothetical protein